MSNYTEGIRRAVGEGFFYSLNVRHSRQQKRCEEGAPLLLSELMALLYPLFVQGRVARCSYPSSVAGLNPLKSHLGNLRDPF